MVMKGGISMEIILRVFWTSIGMTIDNFINGIFNWLITHPYTLLTLYVLFMIGLLLVSFEIVKIDTKNYKIRKSK